MSSVDNAQQRPTKYEYKSRSDYRRSDRNWTCYGACLCERGARLIISGRRDEAGAKLVTELRELGAQAECVRADVRIEEEVHNLVAQTIKRFGRIECRSQ